MVLEDMTRPKTVHAIVSERIAVLKMFSEERDICSWTVPTEWWPFEIICGNSCVSGGDKKNDCVVEIDTCDLLKRYLHGDSFQMQDLALMETSGDFSGDNLYQCLTDECVSTAFLSLLGGFQEHPWMQDVLKFLKSQTVTLESRDVQLHCGFLM